MVKKTTIGLLVAAAWWAAPLSADLCTTDNVPAATLLLPYFEVDLESPGSFTTLMSVNNATAEPVLAHVTFWTDQSVPTLDFDLYLTGFDVQTINLRDVFNGHLPRTADAARDPGDTISPQGELSGDASFPGCGATLPYDDPALSDLLRTHLREAHVGHLSPVYGRCAGLDYGGPIWVARGYVTIDAVNACNLEFPSSPGYFAADGSGLARNENVIWGDYFYVSPGENYAQGEPLVHIEACVPGPRGLEPQDDCPFVAGDYTFYGRYVAASAADQREPLGTTWANRYMLGGGFDGGTDLIVWRDAKTVATTGFACGSNASWFPLNQADVVAFDEEENPTDLCFRGDNISPPIGGADACFPAEAQRVNLRESIVPGGTSPDPPADFGWLYLNLNTTVSGGLFGATAQSYVTAIFSAQDRFSVGFSAIALDNACDTVGTGTLLIP
ncbi:MAG: hypothetical protein SF066_21640 [Thermoanaerobaculia bacterium]|nr:hypothetical protein [Thermoanaerobaculia bacterium]